MDSKSKTRKESREATFLSRKRERKDLSDNFIFRQTLSGNLEGEYEQVAHTFRNLCAFDWEDEKITKNKFHPCKIIINL